MPERNQTVTLHGNPVTLKGQQIGVGDAAPDFCGVKTDLSPVHLSDYRGKVVVLSAVPSLDTPVCDKETRRFSEEARNISPDIRIVTISTDLPFAQKRWADKHEIRNVDFISDHRECGCGNAYGIELADLRLLARSVFVIDREGRIRYAEILENVGHEPNYDAALAAARQLV